MERPSHNKMLAFRPMPLLRARRRPHAAACATCGEPGDRHREPAALGYR